MEFSNGANMFTSKFLKSSGDVSVGAVLATHRSTLFARRAAMRFNVRPTEPPPEMPEYAVAPEIVMALALTDETTPTCIRPSMDDLTIAAAESSLDMPDAGVAAPPSADGEVAIAEPNPVAPETAMPEAIVPATKVKKTARIRKNEMPRATQRKRASRKKSGTEVAEGGKA